VAHYLLKQKVCRGSKGNGSARVAIADLLYCVRSQNFGGFYRQVVNLVPFEHLMSPILQIFQGIAVATVPTRMAQLYNELGF
jgi:hypothetical protein